MSHEPNSDLTKGIETVTCGRCGGCGQYSYCQMYGTKCFGCAGRGTKMTKRGAMANKFLLDLRSKRADELQVGWFARVFSSAKWRRITEIKPVVQRGEYMRDGVMIPYEQAYIAIETSAGSSWVAPSEMIQCLPPTAEEQKAWSSSTWAQAMEYQQSLTKNGKPRVVRAATK